MNVSAIIVVKYSPPHFQEMLDSIEEFVSEIIIGDVQMDEKLKKELEQNPKVKIISLPPTIPYADLVKEDLKKESRGEYILYMDPDEVLPKETILLLEEKKDTYDYVLFPRKNFIFGKWIAHSKWWPDYQLRFFKRDAVTWPKTIHPIAEKNGREFRIEPKEKYAIVHYNYENLDEFMEKMPRYAKGDAKERLEQNEEYTLHKAIKEGISEFIGRFFSSEGYKDGMHGLVLSFLQMFYYLLVYFYTWELKKYPEMSSKEMANIASDYFKQGFYETTFWKDKSKLGSSSDKIKMKIIKRL